MGAAPRTLSLWVRSTRTAADRPDRTIVNWGSYDGGRRFGLVDMVGNAYFVGGSADLSTTCAIVDGRWHHVAITYSGGSLAVHVDGAACRSGSLGLATGAQTMVIGRVVLDSTSDPTYFRGDVDDLRVYARVLSAMEIANLSSER